MIYLAVPIADPDPAVVKYRVETATRIATALYEAGIPVFSSATHGYGFASLANPLQPAKRWDYWSRIDLPILTRCCTLLAVIGLPGYEESVGVSAERREAAKLGIPVFYMLGIGTERGIAEGTEKLIRAWGLEIAARA